MAVKSNHLIEARYRLSTSEQRLVLLLAAAIKPDETEIRSYRFRVSDLGRLLNTGSKNTHRRVHESVYRLMQRVLTIRAPNGDYKLLHWLDSASYYEGEGSFELKFSKELRPYLIGLAKQFKGLELGPMLQLRSKYSVRIYELLKQYEDIKYRRFELQELRAILGIKNDEYTDVRDLRSRVIEKAQKELRTHTDIRFTFKRVLKDRKIAGFDFTIKPNTPKKKAESISSPGKEAQQSLNYPAKIIERSEEETRKGLEEIRSIIGSIKSLN